MHQEKYPKIGDLFSSGYFPPLGNDFFTVHLPEGYLCFLGENTVVLKKEMPQLVRQYHNQG
jgi:hypothetical protein